MVPYGIIGAFLFQEIATSTFVPPKRGVAFTFWVGLPSQADTKLLQSSPTLAAGDVTISKDSGAFANLATLPTVSPAGSKAVKVDVNATEMTADNIVIIFSDAAGAQWCDLLLNIQTTARQIDDLAFPVVSGRGLDVDANGGAEVGTLQAGAITEAAFNADTAKYQAKIWLFDDDAGTTDRYTVAWFKNGEAIFSGISGPLIQVFKASDGTDLVASAAMTQIATTGTYKYETTTNRIVSGAAYFAKVSATIDGSTRTAIQPIGRDTA